MTKPWLASKRKALESRLAAAQDDLQAFMIEHECAACIGSGCRDVDEPNCRCLPSHVCTCDHCERCAAIVRDGNHAPCGTCKGEGIA